MVLGYDEKRPSKINYQDFLERFSKGLKNLGEDKVSLMIYGSYVRGDNVFGRSDIDSVLVFSGDVVVDKKVLRDVSKVYSESQKSNNIPFQATVSDLKTMREGTFNSFDPNFKDYFDEEGKILVGRDYRKLFNYQIANLSDQNSLRFNLRKSRAGLFFSEYDKNNNYKRFLERFNKSIDATSISA